jgi:hypothetical protein
MKNTKKKLNGKALIVKSSFSGSNITKYAGLNGLARYMNREGLIKSICALFPTQWHNATKFGTDQILTAIVLAALSGINRMNRISSFSGDGLVRTLLRLEKGINADAILGTLKKLGENGARGLQAMLLPKNAKWLGDSGLKKITLDADSTVRTVHGDQQGAEKGYSPGKRGAKSYHPLLVFVSEMKLLYHSWFRTGSAYTSNGIVD